MFKRLICHNTADNTIFNVFFFFLLSRFHLVFLPTTLASLPPRVMLLNRSTTPRGTATDIEKTSSLVKIGPMKVLHFRYLVPIDILKDLQDS